MREVAIAGVAMTPFGVSERTNIEMFSEAALDAIAASRLAPGDIEALFFGNCLGDFEEGQLHMAPFVHSAIGLPMSAPATRFESACATATVAIRHAALLVAAGSLNVQQDLTRVRSREGAAVAAYKQAGIGPGDIDVCELHDCFTIAEILAVEALGFYEPGRVFMRPPGAIPGSEERPSPSTRREVSSPRATPSALPAPPRWWRSSPSFAARRAHARSTAPGSAWWIRWAATSAPFATSSSGDNP